ncbi:MAG: family acetyltransferase [Paenibacillaceae bacterium]|jgi:ribosomal protein S18 acetylase RimI-like enzyme|nr:family acetyltransferase [Paenibacillaceae bacterium]
MEAERTIRLIDLYEGNGMLELLALQMAAYVKEAEMIGLTDIPPLLESPASVRSRGEAHYGLYEDNQLAGAVSLKLEHGGLGRLEMAPALRICRLMVHPAHLRRGVASRLIRYAIAAGQAEEAKYLTVSAVSVNEAALALYSRFGFITLAQHAAVHGLTLNEMLLEIDRCEDAYSSPGTV